MNKSERKMSSSLIILASLLMAGCTKRMQVQDSEYPMDLPNRIQFPASGVTLDERDKAILDQIAEVQKAEEEMAKKAGKVAKTEIVITAYTSHDGALHANLIVAAKRAKAVYEYLKQLGVVNVRIHKLSDPRAGQGPIWRCVTVDIVLAGTNPSKPHATVAAPAPTTPAAPAAATSEAAK